MVFEIYVESLRKIFLDDVIFITSDGVSDNFDPVVGKFCVIKRPSESVNPSEKCEPIAV